MRIGENGDHDELLSTNEVHLLHMCQKDHLMMEDALCCARTSSVAEFVVRHTLFNHKRPPMLAESPSMHLGRCVINREELGRGHVRRI